MFKNLALLLILLYPTYSFAYIGPGSGLSAIGSFIALISLFFFALFGFIWFPLKRLFKKKEGHNKEKETDNDASE
jgi:Na+/melibiose symporter-like transporter